MQNDLTRPIIGIENRTAQEVFNIMCDRFRQLSATVPAGDGELVERLTAEADYLDANLKTFTGPLSTITALRDAASRLSQGTGVDRDALKRIHRKLAEEGGGTWGSYMMIEIAAAYGDLQLVPDDPALSGDTL